MATASRKVDRDRWKVVPATWKQYLRLEAARGERATPRYTYTNGRLTIVSPGPIHERLGERCGDLLKIVFDELEIDSYAVGSVTLKQGEPGRKGAEADRTFYLTNIDKVISKDNITIGDDPPPDLVVQVVVSHPVRDSLLVHAAHGVREVWVLKQKGLTILKLGENGRYAVSATSQFVPALDPSELFQWLMRDDFATDRQLRRAFRTWVIESLVPRSREQKRR